MPCVPYTPLMWLPLHESYTSSSLAFPANTRVKSGVRIVQPWGLCRLGKTGIHRRWEPWHWYSSWRRQLSAIGGRGEDRLASSVVLVCEILRSTSDSINRRDPKEVRDRCNYDGVQYAQQGWDEGDSYVQRRRGEVYSENLLFLNTEGPARWIPLSQRMVRRGL